MSEQFNKRELEILADLLELASDEFGNHGCNDFVLTRDETTDHMVDVAYYGDVDPADRAPFGGEMYVQDHVMMDYFGIKIKSLLETNGNGVIIKP